MDVRIHGAKGSPWSRTPLLVTIGGEQIVVQDTPDISVVEIQQTSVWSLRASTGGQLLGIGRDVDHDVLDFVVKQLPGKIRKHACANIVDSLGEGQSVARKVLSVSGPKR